MAAIGWSHPGSLPRTRARLRPRPLRKRSVGRESHTEGAGMTTAGSSNMDTINRGWWAVVIRGVLALVFGVLTLAMPGISLLTLVMLFGGYTLVEGIANIVTAFQSRAQSRWWMLMLQGLVSVAVAVITMVTPGITAIALVYMIGVWALVTGVLEIVAAIRMRKVIRGEWLLGLAGVLSIGFGVLVLAAPRTGALAIVAWIAAYAMVLGVMLIALGFRMRAHRKDQPTAEHAYAR
jgi:uncharacterized membrane protein HdeD (DUF308 family)